MIGVGEQKIYFETFSVFFFLLLMYPITRKRSMGSGSSLRSCRPFVIPHQNEGSRLVPFLTAQQVNLPTCSPHCPFNAERPAEKLWILILKSLVWPDSELSPSIQLPRRTLLPTPPSELLAIRIISAALACYRDGQNTGPAAATSCFLSHYAVFLECEQHPTEVFFESVAWKLKSYLKQKN